MNSNNTTNDRSQTPPKYIIKKKYVCSQTKCICPRTVTNKIHCLDYPKMLPCYGKICNCFTPLKI